MSALTGSVTITKQHYYDLLMSEAELRELENCGVDNWSGCDNMWEYGPDREEVEKDILKHVNSL